MPAASERLQAQNQLSSDSVHFLPPTIEHSEIRQMLERLPKENGEPVEFELPDRLNNKKPDFTFIRRNIYPTKKDKRGFPWDNEVSCSCNSTPGSSGVCDRDCRSGILMFSYSANCESDESCLNMYIPFDQRPVKKMKLVQTEKCGFGVVSEEDIMQGEFIIEYVGEVIDYKTCEERLWRLKGQGETNFYLCEANQDMVIDATHKGNMSRYINHSCSPNTEMQNWTVDGETRMPIFATRDIKKGEQLTCDYKFMWFGADQDCYCGSLGCRTKLGVRPRNSNVPSDAAIKMDASCQVAAINTPKAKAPLSGKTDKTEHSEMGQVFERLPKEIGNGEPERLNKLNPDFTYISRNIFVTPTKKVKKRVQVEDDGIFCSCSSTPGSSSSGVCARDCHCGLLLSTCSSSCKCDDKSCLNIPFDKRPIKEMKLVQTEKCGSGVVAEEDIKKGEFIIEYLGEVIDDKMCEERLWKMKGKGETNFYLCEVERDMVIDATHKGNTSRYINHSCSPNTEMQKWRIDGETRIGIFATRNIKKGEHLSYDYQFVQFGADQDCHCGSLGCRTKLGVRPKKSKFPASDAATNMVACQAAINTTLKAKAVLSSTKDAYNNGVHQAECSSATDHTNISHDCVGEVVVIHRPGSNRLFGTIKRYDIGTRKHLILFESGGVQLLDLTQVDWELCDF